MEIGGFHVRGLWKYMLFVLAVSVAVAIGYPLVKGAIIAGANKVGAKGVANYESQG